MVTRISHSPAETEALGTEWAAEAQAGWVIGLTGELGSGKTQLVKGLARGLGATERIHSPTFTLVNEYASGRLILSHLDLYRLESPAQIIAAGLEEYFFNPKGVTVVEWVERWIGEGRDSKPGFPDPPARFRRARLEHLSETERRIAYEDFGP